ncbi:glutamate-rich protein 2 isoform X2 [Rhinatrema bivittatum]|uniref:glutamate-rich protein 2 isoform X2 n=1 Tax=Rhinatrema bivittatum TaxID=194408 RepID=UPI00112C65D6|nr:glutamate-rich protein 2 isoform X2 [Rhinatrema bivittatum]
MSICTRGGRGRGRHFWQILLLQGPGRLEVLHPEDGFVVEPCLTVSRMNSSETMDVIKDSKDKQNGKLQVLGTTEELVIESIETAPRSGSIGAWQGPAGNKKNYTPTKKISLSALKASPGREGIFAKDMDKNSNKIPKSDALISCDDVQENTGEKERLLDKVPGTAWPAPEFQSPSIDIHNINEKLSENTNKDGEDEESSDDLSEKEDEKERAPIELMGEFLAAIMDEDYKLASKLCQMILIYEPENPEAIQFMPLIEKKLQIEENEQNSGDENDEETDDDSSDESDDTTSDDSESEENSEETSDDLSDQEGASGNSVGHNLMSW